MPLQRANSDGTSADAKKQKVEENIDKDSTDDKTADKTKTEDTDNDEDENERSWYIPHEFNIRHNFHVMKK